MTHGSGSENGLKDFIHDALRIVAFTIMILAVGMVLFPWWRDEPRKLGDAFAAVALYGILLTACRQWARTSHRHKRWEGPYDMSLSHFFSQLCPVAKREVIPAIRR